MHADDAQKNHLKESIYILNHLFQRSNDAFAVLDNELNFTLINSTFTNYFFKIFTTKIQPGINLKLALKKHPKLSVKVMQACEDALIRKKATVLLENNFLLDKFYYCYEFDINLFSNQLIVNIKDITQQKIEEKNQRAQQQNLAISFGPKVLEEMTSALAHEINQPLTAILAYSQSCLLLLKRYPQEKNIHQLLTPLQHIVTHAEYTGKIIHNMCNIFQEKFFFTDEIDINLLLQSTLSTLNHKLDIKLNLENNLPNIRVNKIHVIQVILNLIQNSIEALHNTPKPKLYIKTRALKKFIAVHISDNGPGIPLLLHDKIFNTHFTTKPQGTGLGLAVCRMLIEKHGGKLTIQKNQQKGAAFKFTLPINYEHH